jgi:membrane protein
MRRLIPTRLLDGIRPWYLTPEIRLWGIINLVWANILADNCVDLAAQMSFYFTLALFPFLLILAAIVGWLPFTGLWNTGLEWITRYLPAESRPFVLHTVFSLSRGHTGFFSLGVVATLWSVSSGFVSLMESLSLAYDARDTRGFWRKRWISLLAILWTVSFCIVALSLLNVGPWIGDALGKRFGPHVLFWMGARVLRWITALSMLSIGLSLLDWALPNVRRAWRIITPGVAFAAFSLVVGSIMFNYYAQHLSSYSATYGALTASIILITWIYIASLILLIAAETNRVLEKLRGDVPAPAASTKLRD